MRWLRSTFFARLIAFLLVVSLLPTLVGQASQASAISVQGSYEVWIRAQLRVPADANLEAALNRAAESRAANIGEFVAAFLAAYESESPDVPVAHAFTERDLTDDGLIEYLQRRYTEIAPDAVLPRLRPATPPVATSLTSPSPSAGLDTTRPAVRAVLGTATLCSVTEHVVPFRILSSARSQGP